MKAWASVPASPSSVTPAARRSGLRPTRATFQPSRPKRCAMDRELPGTQNPAPFSSSELFFGAGYPLSTFMMADA